MAAKLQNGAFGKIRANVLQCISSVHFNTVLECGAACVFASVFAFEAKHNVCVAFVKTLSTCTNGGIINVCL